MIEPLSRDPDVTIYCGHAVDVLEELPERSVHAVLTSPPFFGLRDYGTGTWEGGDPACPHERPTTNMNQGFNERWGQGGCEKRQERKSAGQYAGTCPDCGAERVDRQIGLEETPEEWADAIVEVCEAARRVLRDDGTLWIEVGDGYASRASGSDARQEDDLGRPLEHRRPVGGTRHRSRPAGLKDKDLIGGPWLLAFALRAAGWWLRGAYVWEKPDAMPESVTDRCTTSHSHVFQFAKRGKLGLPEVEETTPA